MAEAVMLAFDVGTSGVKASMISQSGEALASATRQYPTFYAPGGIAEQAPDDWWRQICAATKELGERNADAMRRIAAIGVSGHMLGCVPVDSGGTPLCNAMIHSDSRAMEQFRQAGDRVGAEAFYAMSGNVLDARSSLCKIMWLKENEPHIYAETAKFLQCKDFVVSKLTGNIDTTDYSDACHAELMDVVRKRYDADILREVGVDLGKLPTLHASCEIVGMVTPVAAREMGISSGIPVIAGGGDGACGSAGAGNIRVGDTYLSLGTTAWFSQVVDAPVIDPRRRVFNIMNLDGGTCSVYGAMQAAGGSITWLQSFLAMDDLDALNALAASAPQGSAGLVFLPYLDGERSPVFDAEATGVLIGLSHLHERKHVARAVFEGTSFALRSILDVFRERGEIQVARAIGGGIHSALWTQMIADICRLRLDILNIDSGDATSLGIAAAAGTAVGLYDNIHDALAYLHVERCVVPGGPNDTYEKNYQVYKELYPRCKDMMHALIQ